MTIVRFARSCCSFVTTTPTTSDKATTAETTAEAADNITAIIDDNHSGAGILGHRTTEICRRLGKIAKILSSV